ncbi:hypothetical protein [Streptomyces sp. NPDC051218]|uniref:hypothetical protein n=1 Tax=Streptomyces sp. NPDC051218 TaxID=3365645 RepID=UPI0037963E9D
MRAFKLWLDRSLAAQTILIFLLGVGVTAGFRRDEHPAVWLVQGTLYAAIATVFVAVQRRRASRAVGTDARRLAELNRKLRHREVPREPEERATMRRLVAENLGQMERGRTWLPYLLGVMALIAVSMFVVGAATGSFVFPLVFAGGVIGFCGWIVWMRRRSLAHCRYMRSALQS